MQIMMFAVPIGIWLTISLVIYTLLWLGFITPIWITWDFAS